MADEKPRAEKLSKLVDYQPAAVVSKTLLKKKTGTVTLFAFAKGEGLSEHSAAFEALVQILEGEVQITINGEMLRLGAGEMVIMPANQPHSLLALSDFKMLLTMIKS